MRSTRKLIFTILPGIFLSFVALSCNTAPDGFNAPQNSTVTLLPTNPSVTTDVDFRLLLEVQVEVPVVNTEVDPTTGAPTTTTTTGPGNDIYVVGTCTNCTIYAWPTGDGRAAQDITKIQKVSNPFPFKTDERGIYLLAILLPAPENLGLTSYTAQFAADIGVVTQIMSVTVNKNTPAT